MANKQTQDTLIFVHGAWHGAWCWEVHFREFFEQAGYQVITFDLPKHTAAGKVNGINRLTIGDYVSALKAQVDKCTKLPIIVGHSMGGFVVQQYLKNHRCKQAVLLASSPFYGVVLTTLRLAKKPYFYPSLLGFNLYHLVNSPAKARFAFFSNQLSEDTIQTYTNKLCDESYLAFLGMLTPVPLKQQTQTPTLVVAAELDTIFSLADMRRTAKHYHADFKLITGSGHDLMLDVKWHETATTIHNWLQQQH